MKKKLSRLLAVVLAVIMVCNMPYTSESIMASELTTEAESTEVKATEETTAVTEDTTESSETTTEVTTEAVTEATTEVVTEATTEVTSEEPTTEVTDETTTEAETSTEQTEIASTEETTETTESSEEVEESVQLFISVSEGGQVDVTFSDNEVYNLKQKEGVFYSNSIDVSSKLTNENYLEFVKNYNSSVKLNITSDEGKEIESVKVLDRNKNEIAGTENNIPEGTTSYSKSLELKDLTYISVKYSDTTDEAKEPTFNKIYEGVSVDGIDFSSKEILVGVNSTEVFTWDTPVISEYNGIYLLRFETVEEAKSAYTYYYNKVNLIDVNTTVRVAEGTEDTVDLSNINEGDDALSKLNDIVNTGSGGSGTIAVIDTGINGSVVDSVSVIGGSTSDDNGHGTKMYNYIKEEYPEASVLSIKAMNSAGVGQVSDVYAAIQYAISKNVSVINLSMSTIDGKNSDIIRTAISEALSRGIVVVASAGNKGTNAGYFVPGNIGGVITVGSCDENGIRLESSNFGSVVDGYVVSESTSEASARMSARVLRDGLAKALESLYDGETAETPSDADVVDVDTDVPEEPVKDIEEVDEIVSELESTDKSFLVKILYVTPEGKNAKSVRDAWENYGDSIITYDRKLVPLYDDGSDRYSAYIKNLAGNLEILDYSFALNNNYGVEYTEGIFNKEDYSISVLKDSYVGKNYLNHARCFNGDPLDESNSEVYEDVPITIELLAVVEGTEDYKVRVDLESELDDVKVKTPSYNIPVNVNDIEVYIPIYAENTDALDVSNFSAYVNGSSTDEISPDTARYEDGKLIFRIEPVSVREVRIVIHESAFDVTAHSGAGLGYANAVAHINKASSSEYLDPSEFNVGDYFSGTAMYYGSSTAANVNARVTELGRESAKFCESEGSGPWDIQPIFWNDAEPDSLEVFNSAGVKRGKKADFLNATWHNYIETTDRYPAPTGYYPLEDPGFVFLPCANHGTSSVTGQNRYKAEVVAKGSNYLVVRFQSSRINTQWGAGKYKFTFDSPDGKISFTKQSSNGAVTNGNPHYTLARAVYGVYNSGNTLVGQFETDENGVGHVIYNKYNTGDVATHVESGAGAYVPTTDTHKTLSKVPTGNYTVKEITAPWSYIDGVKSSSFKLSGATYSVTVRSNETATVTATDDYERGWLQLTKKSAVPNITDGNAMYDLTGAEYTVYSVSSSSADISTGTVVGKFRVVNNNGDSVVTQNIYNNADVTNGSSRMSELPLGYYKIKETKAPDNGSYDISAEVFNVQLSAKDKSNVITAKEPCRFDPIAVEIHKQDAKTGDIVQGASSLEGAVFKMSYYDTLGDISGASPERVWYFETRKIGDKYRLDYDEHYLSTKYTSSELYYQLNPDGSKRFLLPLGTLTVEEFEAPAGYTIEGNRLTFTDASNNLSTSYDNNKVVIQIKQADGRNIGKVDVLSNTVVGSDIWVIDIYP